jgi:uracil-DNA glycosylase
MTKSEELEKLESEVSSCFACKLSSTRTRTVFGEGNPNSELMFIGEGPGKNEDLTGRPFVGKAGELFTRILEKGLGISRSNVYIGNIVKCRPTVDMKFEKDRPPEKDEVFACNKFILKQIEIIQPKVIVSLGNPATKFLLNREDGITKLRGKWFQFAGIPLLPTYHPSFILRSKYEEAKKEIWDDFLKVMAKLNWEVKTKIKWKT